MIKEEEAPQFYSYSFRCGQELPSFHESIISLSHDTLNERIDIHRPADESMTSLASALLPSESDPLTGIASEFQDWRDAIHLGDFIAEEVVDDDGSQSRRRSNR